MKRDVYKRQLLVTSVANAERKTKRAPERYHQRSNTVIKFAPLEVRSQLNEKLKLEKHIIVTQLPAVCNIFR